jgi:hypothetical protein
MLKYKIIDSKENPKETVIEKSGVKVEITLGNMEAQYNKVLKLKEEVEAQILVDKAQVTNCETNYPGIENATEEEEKRAIALTLRKGNLTEIETYEKKLAEINEAIADYEAEIAEIKKQTGIND